ncbi:hypothetical protein [Peribacillus loiseleuriae]|uniref:hypothetical protein n=1 Tax=Peribacillus loiseleuriae TaxID=1679170 RepID=UPI00069F2C85|nr:hypothetical protein [Peribacillus loiseleuriae]
MFKNRTETIPFNDFMSEEYKYKPKPQKATSGRLRANYGHLVEKVQWIPIVAVSAHIMNKVSPVFAATTVQPEAIVVTGAIPGAVKEKIIHAFDPLVELIMGVSLPIASVMITGGALLVMIGIKDKGYSMIMSSAIGYVLVQMTPLLIDLLAGVGSAI